MAAGRHMRGGVLGAEGGRGGTLRGAVSNVADNRSGIEARSIADT